jgi:molybdate transport system substrate-binding protein
VRGSAAFVLFAACSSHSDGHTVRVAAASDLSVALPALAQAFTQKTGITPVFDFQSSGLLAKQIEAGAPYSLFAAASRTYVDQVIASGKCDASTAQSYSRGTLVVWTNSGEKVALADLAEERFKRIAIANPDHAPYGHAAEQALKKANLYDRIHDRLVIAESVQMAMTFAQQGSADVAIVALALAIGDGSGGYTIVDPALYPPLDQALVVCGTGADAAAGRQLAQYIESAEGKAILARYGFAP